MHLPVPQSRHLQMSSPLLFSQFRQHFVTKSAWLKEPLNSEQPRQTAAAGWQEPKRAPLVKLAGLEPVRGEMMKPLLLDLSKLPFGKGSTDSSLDYDELRRQKFAKYEMQCSQVAEGVYVSGAAVAQDRAILAAHGITHVVNCVGALYPEYFKDDRIAYKTLWLADTPHEDITCILYDAFDFMEEARKGSTASSSSSSSSSSSGGGRVLVHCSQGVSRSTSIAIAYLMWRTGGTYQEVYQAVRALRGVTSPNVGFTCQLINWAKRRQQQPDGARVYRIAPHCPDNPTYLVAKPVGPKPGCSHADVAALDSRGCFVVHLPHSLCVWRGSSCPGVMADAGLRAAAALVRYEGAPQPQLVQQGEEPEEFLAALNPSSSSTSRGSAQPDGTAAAGADDASMQLGAGGEKVDASLAGAEAAAAAAVELCTPLQGASHNSSSSSSAEISHATAGGCMAQQGSSLPFNAGSSSSSSSSSSGCTSEQHLPAEAMPGADGDGWAAGSMCSSSAPAIAASRSSSWSSSTSDGTDVSHRQHSADNTTTTAAAAAAAAQISACMLQ
ncbi:protein-tyrosine phosphatase-like protein [Scenedesmus sp. NREL 46B-D3]|nr:protein-tyrosine phosphatase-like protein [Scenedesmus sp. NREL 46B-D3]